MRIGLDFDNTIACYDEAITLLAEHIFALPKDIPRTKLGIRNYLRSEGREAEWTAFQGELYGPGMEYASPFRGAVEAMRLLSSTGHELIIISHRSRIPYAGKSYDLHKSARNWIEKNIQSQGVMGHEGDQTNIHFMETMDRKVDLIGKLQCEVFVDDLIEILCNHNFPASTHKILFSPSSINTGHVPKEIPLISTWEELPKIIFER